MASLDAVLEVIYALRGQAVPAKIAGAPPVTFNTGDALLAEHATRSSAPRAATRATRIMVTMPGQAADDPKLIRDLVESGMQVMRINCAHDGPEVWARMVKLLRRAEHATGMRSAVSFDLAGPKLPHRPDRTRPRGRKVAARARCDRTRDPAGPGALPRART